MKRIKKIEKELDKVRKENKKIEYTNQIYGEEMSNSKHLEYLNDLCYVIKINLKLIDDKIKAKTHEEGSISNVPQPTVG